MNPGYARRVGQAWTFALGVVLTLVDLAISAFLLGLVGALLPGLVEWGALAGFALASLALFAWPRPGRVRRLLGLWCAPVDFLRGLAVGFRRWLAGFPFLDLVWRARFTVGIAAIIQNWQEGTPQFGLIPAGIIAFSYLWPWLRRVHARRVEAAGVRAVRRVREVVAPGTPRVPSGRAEPLKGVLR
ncbi:MAG: hypothetical protein AAGC63_15740 [Propionicimonas sp.]|nr:hypothetical protein [Propionicimonas sp.]